MHSIPRVSKRWASEPIEVAEATAIAADERTGCGAHSRSDFPDRDDENWLCHSIFDPATKTLRKPVNFQPKGMDAFQPAVRTY